MTLFENTGMLSSLLKLLVFLGCLWVATVAVTLFIYLVTFGGLLWSMSSPVVAFCMLAILASGSFLYTAVMEET